MDTASRRLLRRALAEFGFALRPLQRAIDSPPQLYLLLGDLGWQLDGLLGADLVAIANAAAEVQAALDGLAQAADGADATTATADVVDAATQAWLTARDRVPALAQALLAGSVPAADPAVVAALAADLLALLLTRYLAHRRPAVLEAARALGVLQPSSPEPIVAGTQTLRHAVPRWLIDIARLEALAHDPAALLLGELADAGVADPAGLDDLAAQAQARLDRLAGGLQAQAAALSLQVDVGRITLGGLDLGLADTLTLPLPTLAGIDFVVELGADAAALVWLPSASPEASVVLFEEGGFSVAALPGAGSSRGLTLALDEGAPALSLAGGFAVGLPANMVALGAGARVTVQAQGDARFRVGDPPALTLARAEVSLADVELGGAGGPRLDGVVAVEQLAFPFDAATAPMVLEGTGTLAVGGSLLTVHARLQGGNFVITTSADLDLGNGIRLAPVDADTPVLAAQLDTAAGTLAGAVAGRLTLIGIGAEVLLTGAATFAVGADGLTLDALALTSSVVGALPLVGGVTLLEAGLSVALDDAGAALSVVGQLRLPGAAGGESRVQVAGRLTLVDDGGVARVAAAAVDSELLGTLALPGHLQLDAASAHLDFADGAFRATVAGRLRLGADMALVDGSGEVRVQAALAYDAADPQRIRLDAVLDAAGLRLGGQAAIFQARVEFVADNGPGGAQPAGQLTLADAGAGLFARHAAPADAADYRLAVTGLSAALVFGPDGFTLALSEGTLWLPPELFAADGGQAPSVALSGADAIDALRLVFDDGSAALDLHGRLLFRDFGVALPGGDGAPAVHLLRAELQLAPGQPPALVDLDGEARLPLPDGETLIVGVESLALPIDGPPSGRIVLGGDIEAIDVGGGFTLGILATDPDGQGRAPGLELIPDGDHLRFLLEGGLRFTAPAALLSADDGAGTPASVGIEGYGSFAFATDPSFTPRFDVEALTLRAQNLRFGGSTGLRVVQAEATVSGLGALVDPASPETLTIDFTGQVEAVAGPDTVTLALEGARFRFVDGPLPEFTFAGIGLGSSAPLFGGLVRVTGLAIGFEEPGRALLPAAGDPALLAPDNIAFTLSAELAVDLGSGVLIGGVEETRFKLDDQGRPVIGLDGFQVGIEGLDIGITSLTGALAVRGLSGQHPPRLVGKLGGQYTGMGLEFLCAVGLPDPPAPQLLLPLGACLDVSGGATGIPLVYGFILNGASGGVSFQNSNASPCDFKAYLGLDDAGNAVPPSTPGAGADDPNAGGAVASARPLPYGDCPAPCPPATMNPLCQPHPDAARFPNRAILRFSSLDEALLTSLGIRAFVDDHFPDLPSVDLTALEDHLRDALAELLPAPSVPVSVPDPALQAILDDPLGYLAAQLAGALGAAVAAVDATLPDPPTPWELLRDTAHAGIPCPDVTLQVTGTFSYTGVGAFASVTGGVSISSTGTIGVLGWLNLLNIPVGQLRAFLILTDANGDPDPAICGDLQLGFGPLQIGQVGFTEVFLGDVQQLGGALADAAAALLPAAWITDELLALDPDAVVGADPFDAVRGLDLQGASNLALRLTRRIAADVSGALPVDAAREFSLTLLQTLLTIYDPRAVMCGQVSPKLFGLPLMGEGLVAFRGWGSPRDMGGMLAFSPSYLIGRVVPGADFFAGMDRATLGFAIGFPDPAQILVDGLRGEFAGPDALAAYLDAGIERLLEQATFTFSFEIAPFGLSLTRTAGRVLMPVLTPHPSDPDTPPAARWRNPDDDPALPDRMQVLAAAVAGDVPGGRLADVLWDGRLDDLPIDGFTWPAGEHRLGRDYFPHGGLVGAGYLQLPRALADTPPMDLLGTIADAGAPPLDRISSLMSYVEQYLQQNVELGSLSFYLPAPDPPTFSVDGEPVGPRRIVQDLAALDLSAVPLAGAPGYRADLAFLRGEVNLVLLGVPIADALIEAVPPADALGSGRLQVRAGVPAGSWLASLVEQAELRFEFTQPPTLPLAARVQALAAALLGETAGAVGDALDALGAALADADAALAARLHPGAAAGDDGPLEAREVVTEALQAAHAEPYTALRDETEALAPLWRAARQAAEADAAGAAAAVADVLAPVLASLRDSLPRVSLHAEAQGLQLPPPLSDWLSLDGGSVVVSAFSPWFDPDAVGDDATARAKREGGIVVRADLRLRAGTLDLALPQLLLALTPSAGDPATMADRLAQMPPIRARRAVGRVALPGTPLVLEAAELRLDSAPPPGGATLSIDGAFEPVEIGKLRLLAADGGALRGGLRAVPVPGQPLGAVEARVEPCFVDLPVLTAATRLRLHGAAGPDDPFTLATAGPWSAALSVEAIALESPYDPTDPPLFSIDPAAQPQVRLEGEGLTSATLVLDLPPGAVTLFPDVPLLRRVMAAGFELRAESDGDLHGSIRLAPLDLGLLRLHGEAGEDAGIEVILRPYGIGLPTGVLVSPRGLSETDIRLRDCVVDGFGHFSVTSTRRTLVIAPWFRFSSSSLRVWNGADGAGLSLRQPRLRLLPDTALGAMDYLYLGAESLDIGSDGAFDAVCDGVLIAAPGLPELSGRLEIGNAPLPGVPLNPYARLVDARISAPPLPELHLDLTITPDAISGAVDAEAITLGGVLVLAPGHWQLAWQPDGAFTLTVDDLGATLFGQPVTLDALSLSIEAGVLTLEAELAHDITLLPGRAAIAAGQLRLRIDSSGARLNTRLRALHDGDDWRIDVDAGFEVRAGNFTASVATGTELDVVDLPGLLTVRADAGSRLRLSFGTSGWSVGVNGLAVRLLGTLQRIDSPAIGSDGATALAWDPADDLALGPFAVSLPSAVTVACNLLADADPLISLPADCVLDSTLAAWPDDGVSLGLALDIPASGDFSRTLTAFDFHGIALASDATIRLRRADGVVAFGITSVHTLFVSVSATLSADIDDAGTLSASVTGDFDLTGLPDPFKVDFGSRTLGYDAGRSGRPFRADVNAGLVRFAIRFGSRGASICVIGTDGDGNEVLGPCWPA